MMGGQKMYKIKSLLYVILFVLLNVAIFLPTQAEFEYRIGAGAEGLLMSNSMEATVSQQDGTATNTRRLEKYGYGGFLNLDVVKNWEKMFLGMDFSIKYDFVNGKISQVDFTDNGGALHTNVTLGLKRLYSLELAPRIGVKSVIEGLNPYFKFGFLFSHFCFTYEDPSRAVLTKERKATWGLVTGAGIDYRINERWGTRIEYGYHWYQRIKTSDLDPHSNISAVYNRVCPRYHTIGIAFYYVF